MKGLIKAVVGLLMLGLIIYSLWGYFKDDSISTDESSVKSASEQVIEVDTLDLIPDVASVKRDIELFLSIWDNDTFMKAKVSIACTPEVNAIYFNGVWEGRYTEYTSKPNVDILSIGSTIPVDDGKSSSCKYFAKVYLSYKDIDGNSRMRASTIVITYVDKTVTNIERRGK